MRNILLVFVNTAVGCSGPPVSTPSARTLPADPVFDTIHTRLGNPDRLTGSGRSFLHYDLPNGQTLMLVVSDDRIVGSEISQTKDNPR